MSASTDGWIALATSMINEFGRASDVTFTRAVTLGYDPHALSNTEGTPLTYTVPAAPVNFSAKGLIPTQEIGGVTTTQSDKKLYVPGGTSYIPAINDSVTLDNTVFRVLAITNYQTESVNCAYMLHIGV